jgi:hypothetical protein
MDAMIARAVKKISNLPIHFNFPEHMLLKKRSKDKSCHGPQNSITLQG